MHRILGSIGKELKRSQTVYLFRFMMYLSRKWRIYKNQRRVAIFVAFFGSMHFGYLWSGAGKNLYTMGYSNHFYQPFDYSLHMMNTYGGDEKTKYTVQILSQLKDGLDSKGECYDTLDWLMMAQHFAKN